MKRKDPVPVFRRYQRRKKKSTERMNGEKKAIPRIKVKPSKSISSIHGFAPEFTQRSDLESFIINKNAWPSLYKFTVGQESLPSATVLVEPSLETPEKI